MNYEIKKIELIDNINSFFYGNKSIDELQSYSWNIIDEYIKENNEEKKLNEDESIFWFTIWQIQHLASEDHLQDGTLTRELKKTLQYLLHEAPMPPESFGLPPNNPTKDRGQQEDERT